MQRKIKCRSASQIQLNKERLDFKQKRNTVILVVLSYSSTFGTLVVGIPKLSLHFQLNSLLSFQVFRIVLI